MTFIELAAVSTNALQTLTDLNIEERTWTPHMCVQPL